MELGLLPKLESVVTRRCKGLFTFNSRGAAIYASEMQKHREGTLGAFESFGVFSM